MAFRISEFNLGTPKKVWMPVDETDTLYVGQIVYSGSDGVLPLGAASGVNNRANNTKIPFGIVVGTNYRTPVYNSTYKANSITGVAASATQAATEKVGGHGDGNGVGDAQAKVEVVVISPDTVIAGPIYNAAYGTALSTFTISVASADGCITAPTGATTNFTPVADLCTMYARTGANTGVMRVTTDASTTQPTCTHGFPAAAVAVGDTFVRVPCRMGMSYIQFDAESMYIEGSASPATDYFVVNVVGLDLKESGKETVHFMFNPELWSVYGRSVTT